MREPAWLSVARGYLGVRETPGKATTPVIRRWLIELRAAWDGDDVPWCGVAAAAWMRAAGITPPRAWYRARAWLSWGMPLESPALGCVVVFERKGGGHVALAVGRDEQGRLLCLGGNQGDRVSIAPFEMSRVLGFRWPLGYPILDEALPVTHSASPSSTQEA